MASPAVKSHKSSSSRGHADPTRRAPTDNLDMNARPSHQQLRYLQAPANWDPFFEPEGQSQRTKRLNNNLDVILTSCQFPKTSLRQSLAVRSPSQKLLRQLNPPVYLASEKASLRKKERMLEMDRALTHVQGSEKHAKKGKGKKAAARDDDDEA